MAVIARESRHDRLVVAQEAGFRRLSFVSVVAGTLCAYGAFAILVAIAAGVLDATNTDTDISEYDWETAGAVGAAVVGGALLLSYLFGGYVAGRMARRAGTLHGVFVFVFGLAAAALIGLAVNGMADTDAIAEDLRRVGIPTTADEWGSVATIAGVASLAAILLGSVLGGMLGDRWHSKLTARAVDPDVGATAERRKEMADRASEREEAASAKVEADTPDSTPREPVVEDTFDRDPNAGPDAAQADREPGVVSGRSTS